jgi:hypothetical protein
MDKKDSADGRAGKTQVPETVKQARLFFTELERLSTVLDGYPPGHPMIEKAVDRSYEALYEYFELVDRLTVKIDAHSMLLPGTDDVVWETESPKDFCFALTRGGIYLIHFLPGLERPDIEEFTRILNTLTKGEHRSRDPDQMFFDADFQYLAYEALDVSMAQLSGLDVDVQDRDTEEEREQIKELLSEVVGSENMDAKETLGMSEDQYDINTDLSEKEKNKLKVGSRAFLNISKESAESLRALKESLVRHDELEYREADMLSAMLSYTSSDKLKKACIKQMGNLMEQLLDSDSPWEGYPFLKLVHNWRNRFDDDIIYALQQEIKRTFNEDRVQELIRHLVQLDKH